MKELIAVLGVLAFVLIIFLMWLMPAIYNYLNQKSNYYHELYIRQLEYNKEAFPERYVPIREKIKLKILKLLRKV